MSDQLSISPVPNPEALCQAYVELVGIYHDRTSNTLDAAVANQRILTSIAQISQLRHQAGALDPQGDALNFSSSAAVQCDVRITRDENLLKVRRNFPATYAYLTGLPFLPRVTGITEIADAGRMPRLSNDGEQAPGQLQAILDSHAQRAKYASQGESILAKDSLSRFMAAGGDRVARAESEISQLRRLNTSILPATDEWVFLFDGIYRAAFASVIANEELPVTSPQTMAADLPGGTMKLFNEHLLCRSEDVVVAYDHTLQRAIADAKEAQQRGHQRPDIENIAQNRLEIANVCQRRSLRRQVQLYNLREAIETERGSGRSSTTHR